MTSENNRVNQLTDELEVVRTLSTVLLQQCEEQKRHSAMLETRCTALEARCNALEQNDSTPALVRVRGNGTPDLRRRRPSQEEEREFNARVARANKRSRISDATTAVVEVKISPKTLQSGSGIRNGYALMMDMNGSEATYRFYVQVCFSLDTARQLTGGKPKFQRNCPVFIADELLPEYTVVLFVVLNTEGYWEEIIPIGLFDKVEAAENARHDELAKWTNVAGDKIFIGDHPVAVVVTQDAFLLPAESSGSRA